MKIDDHIYALSHFICSEGGTDVTDNLREALNSAISALRVVRDARSYPTWIRVIDTLPEKDGSYIVYSGKSGKVFTAHFWARDNHWSGRSLDLTVTHWMPLPLPPKEVQHDG